MSKQADELRVTKNAFSVCTTIFGFILLNKEHYVVIALVRIGLNVPFFDVIPFTDVFPMSNLLEE